MSERAPFRPDTTLFLGGITALTAISIDIVLPTTGVVARYFGVAEQSGALLVGIYFIAYAIGQMFWGLFSDAYGRRLALILSLSGFALASLACALAPTLGFLIAARFIQGLMGAAPIIARAMVRDVSRGETAARMMTLLGAILTVSTMIAPVLGSGLLLLFSWRAIFVALMVLSLIFLVFTIIALEETGKRRPERFSLRFIIESGGYLLTNRRFVIPMLAGGFIFGGFTSLSGTGAIIAETRYGVEPEAFGALYALAAMINTAGALSAGQLLRMISLRQVGTVASTLLAVVVTVHLFLMQAEPNLPVFWAGVCAYVLVFGVAMPTSQASAMEPAGEMPGFAASVMGAIQMTIGASGAFLASTLFDGTHVAVSYCMVGFGTLAVLTVFVGRLLDLRSR